MVFGLGVLVGVLIGGFVATLVCSAIAVSRYQE